MGFFILSPIFTMRGLFGGGLDGGGGASGGEYGYGGEAGGNLG